MGHGTSGILLRRQAQARHDQGAAAGNCYFESGNSKFYLKRNYRFCYSAKVRGQLAMTGLK